MFCGPASEHVADGEDQEGREDRHRDLGPVHQDLAEPPDDPGIGDEHLAGDPAEERGAGPDQDRAPSRSAMIRAAPAMISGIEMASPSTSSKVESFATAAMARTLSRLITASATAMVQTACQSRSVSLTSPCSSSSVTSFTAIQSSRQPPMILRKGVDKRATTRTVKTMRSATATPAPRIMPTRRLSSGRPRQAIAMTTALSPERMMLIQMIPRSLRTEGRYSSMMTT